MTIIIFTLRGLFFTTLNTVTCCSIASGYSRQVLCPYSRDWVQGGKSRGFWGWPPRPRPHELLAANLMHGRTWRKSALSFPRNASFQCPGIDDLREVPISHPLKEVVCGPFVPPHLCGRRHHNDTLAPVLNAAVFHENLAPKAETQRYPPFSPLLSAPLRFFPGRRKSPPIEHGAFSAPCKMRAIGPLRALCQTLFVWRRARFGPQPATVELAHARLLLHSCRALCLPSSQPFRFRCCELQFESPYRCICRKSMLSFQKRRFICPRIDDLRQVHITTSPKESHPHAMPEQRAELTQ